MSYTIYLQKEHIQNDVNNLSIIFDMFEPAEDYLKKIDEKNCSESFFEDLKFHIRQLVDIYVDCRLISEWEKSFSLGNKFAYNFIRSLENKDFLIKKVGINSLKYPTNEKFKKFVSEFFNEEIDELYNNIIAFINNAKILKYFWHSKYVLSFNQFLSILIAKGIAPCLRIFLEETGTEYNINVKKDADKIYNYPYFLLAEKFIYCENYYTREIIKNDHFYFDNISKMAFSFISNIWDKIQTNNKFYSKYKDCSTEKLIDLIKSKYNISPHFFEILKNYKYKNGKNENIIMNSDFTINEGFQNLVITYFDNSRKSLKATNDWSLIGALIGAEPRTLSGVSRLSDEKYYENFLMPFEKFLDECEENYITLN